MTVTLNDITGSDTFDTWRERTNDLLDVAAKTVTMSGDANVGDILLTGDLLFQAAGDKISVSHIEKTVSTNFLELESNTRIDGSLTIDPGAGNIATIVLANNGTDKWKIKTNNSDAQFRIEDVVQGDYFQIENGSITTSGLTISEDTLPDTSTRRVVHSGTGSDASSFADVDISAGIIQPTQLTASGTGNEKTVIAEVDINDGTIDGTAIGTTAQSTGKFTTVSTVANGDYEVHGTGGFKGDLKKGDGSTVIDVDTDPPFFYGKARDISSSAIQQVADYLYPVGSLFMNTTATNPYNIIGVGNGESSWAPYCEGRSPLGYMWWQNIETARALSGSSTITEVRLGSDQFGRDSIDKFAPYDQVTLTGFINGNGNFTVHSISGDWLRIFRSTSYSMNQASAGSRKVKYTFAKDLGRMDGNAGHVLTTGQMPKHRHQLGIPRDVYGTADNAALMFSKNHDESVKFEHYSDYQGNNDVVYSAHKSQTIYIWKRVAV